VGIGSLDGGQLIPHGVKEELGVLMIKKEKGTKKEEHHDESDDNEEIPCIVVVQSQRATDTL
jgi:hypothetical protein